MRTANTTAGGSAAKTPALLLKKEFVVFLICLSAVLIVLFRWSFHPSFMLFSNDGPLGIASAQCRAAPGCFTGIWEDVNWVGLRAGNLAPGLTGGLYWLLGPFYFGKFFAPLAVLFLGTSAWFFIRQLGLGPVASILAGLAAALTPDFFCDACWGTGPHLLCYGSNYFALGLVVSRKPMPAWVRYPLAGMAVGIGVMEGADI